MPEIAVSSSNSRHKKPDVWFIADTHFGHANIIQFEPVYRPFSTIEEHDEQLIQNWNDVVKPDDTIFHLGDFCFGGWANVHKYASRLNGHKRIVLGNHDCYGIQLYADNFERVFGAVMYKEFILTHIPINHIHRKDMVNIHGHLHSKQVEYTPPPTRAIMPSLLHVCVSVEQTGLKPIHIDEIRRLIHERNIGI